MKNLDNFRIGIRSTILDAIDQIAKNHSRTVIVEDGNKVVGIISEGDILRLLLRGSSVYSPIEQHIKLSFKFLTERDESEALNLYLEYGVLMLPVLSEDFRLQDVILIREVIEKLR